MKKEPSDIYGKRPEGSVHFLDEELIQRIDRALRRVGEFGQVRLVVIKGRLRFIEITQSENVNDP